MKTGQIAQISGNFTHFEFDRNNFYSVHLCKKRKYLLRISQSINTAGQITNSNKLSVRNPEIVQVVLKEMIRANDDDFVAPVSY